MSKRIGIIILIGFVALVHASCDKSNGSVSTQEEKALIDFAAKSQSAATKGTSLSEHHQDFGVWGIARKSGQMDYMLWEPSAMIKVERQGTTDVYAPVEDAFWLGGYTYNFIAVAPWEEAADGISSISSGTVSGEESLTFPFDLAGKYDEGVYDFDLMAAVAETAAKASATDVQQPLIFWHLLSQINIKVAFVEADGETPANGRVSQIRIYNVDQDASYTISSNADESINVACQEGERKYGDTPIVFNKSDNSSWTLNIVPQDRRPFKLFMDFTLVKGNDTVAYWDFEVNLEGAANPENYGYNEMFNWNIKIGPKATISFSIEVENWGVSDVPDGDDDNDNEEVEII